MATIDQVAAAGQPLSGSDELLVAQLNQGGQRVTAKAQVADMLALLAASHLSPTSILLGQGAPGGNVGADGDGYLDANTGNLFERASGTWTKIGDLLGPQGAQGPAGPSYSMSALATVTTVTDTDLVGISQTGADKNISLANFLEGQTIDQGTPAGAASDTDTFWTGQGGATMLVQTLAAVWTWIAGRLPGWKRPVVEIATNTQLDASIHNNAILVCSKPVTISPAFATQGSGFTCAIVNASSAAVTLGAGFTSSSGQLSVPVGQVARISAVAYSGGNLNFAEISGGGTGLAAPGQVTGLAAGTVTASSVALSWTGPGSGGAPASYAVSYRVTGAGTWSSVSASGTSATVTGLSASTQYDFEVAAVNSAGTGAASPIVNATTGAATAFPPNLPTAVTVGSVTSSTVPITWTAPATDGSHGAATSYTVQWRQTGTSTWTQQSGVSTASYTIAGLIAATEYDLQVQAVNGAGSSAFTATVNATTGTASGNYAMGSGYQPLGNATSYAHSTDVTANVSDMTTAAGGSHTAPANVYFGWSTSATQAPTSTADMSAAQGQFANGGSNYWYSFNVPAPATPGSYYFWSVETDAGGNIVASVVQGDQVISGGNPVAFTIT